MLKAIEYILWVVPTIVLAWLGFTMVQRNLRQRYPFFFAYLVFQVALFVVQFGVYQVWPAYYFRVYWPTTALGIFVSFAVVYELFCEVFAPFDGLKDLGGALFRWAAVVLIVAAVLIAVTTMSPGASIQARLVISLERSIRVMQCGIVLLMILCAPCVGLTRQHRIFGIASGFGVIAAIDLISTAAVARMGISSSTAVFNTLAHMISFAIAVGMWTVYMLRTEPARDPVAQYAPSERWNYALSSVMHPESSAPSLPLIMGAVDRTFQKLNLSRSASGPSHADQ